MLSGIFILFLPPPIVPPASELKDVPVSSKPKLNPFTAFLHMPAAQLPGSKLLLFMRLFMALAFHVFMTVWTVSLKERFNFQAADHAKFMGWVGLWYALSQGFLAQRFITENPTNLLLTCIVGLGMGRLLAMLTTSIIAVYALMAAVIVALGIMNTAMSSACSRLADADQVGGLIGLTEAVESMAGLLGPALGGLMFRVHPQMPIVTVVAIYLMVFVAVLSFYKKHIVEYKAKESSAETMILDEHDAGDEKPPSDSPLSTPRRPTADTKKDR